MSMYYVVYYKVASDLAKVFKNLLSKPTHTYWLEGFVYIPWYTYKSKI